MASAPPLGKHLASSDKKTRDKAMQGLSAFICHESNAALSKSDMAKLWKGIFYCFWMSDKPLVQQALATDLANILLSIPSLDAALAFLRGFWEALVREWSGLDRLRMDKYYMLVRRYVNASFRLLMRSRWDSSACETYNNIMSGPSGPLFPNDSKIPTSLAYHLADIYLGELDKVLSSFGEDAVPAPLIALVSPFFHLAAETPSNITFKRIQTAFVDPLVSALQTASSSQRSDDGPSRKRARLDDDAATVETSSENEESGDVDTPLYHLTRLSYTPELSTSDDTVASSPLPLSSPQTVQKAIIRTLFDIASKDTSRDANRRKLYTICKAAKDDIEEDD